MFPAPPLKPMLHQEDEEDRPSQPAFGALTPVSRMIAFDIKQPTPSANIAELFSLIEAQQASVEMESSEAASSVPVTDDKQAVPDAEFVEKPQPMPTTATPRSSKRKAPAKSKTNTEVDNKDSTDF